MIDCVFCQIASGQISAQIIYEDDRIIAFKDIHPITPVHLLIIPKNHINSLNEMEVEDAGLLGFMVYTARELARQIRLQESGYRLVINTGPDAGQSVFHLHIHLLGGRKMPFHFNQ
jgi:histidine triad (HIT) family protein